MWGGVLLLDHRLITVCTSLFPLAFSPGASSLHTNCSVPSESPLPVQNKRVNKAHYVIVGVLVP